MEADTAVRQIVRECGFNCRGPNDQGFGRALPKGTLEIYRWLGPDDMCVTDTLGYLAIKDGLRVKIYGVTERNERDIDPIVTVSLYDPDSIGILKKHILALKNDA
jgi:hypothetical protein